MGDPDFSTSDGICLLGGSPSECIDCCKECRLYKEYLDDNKAREMRKLKHAAIIVCALIILTVAFYFKGKVMGWW